MILDSSKLRGCPRSIWATMPADETVMAGLNQSLSFRAATDAEAPVDEAKLTDAPQRGVAEAVKVWVGVGVHVGVGGGVKVFV